VLCADGPVRTLAGLSLAPEHRRGHGAVYDAVSQGRVEIARLRRTVARLPLPRSAEGRIVLAADVSPWLRPDAATSPDRLFCHVHGRGKAPADPGGATPKAPACRRPETASTRHGLTAICPSGSLRQALSSDVAGIGRKTKPGSVRLATPAVGQGRRCPSWSARWSRGCRLRLASRRG